MKTIIVVQHCQSEHHMTRMIGGVTDWDLTEEGIHQATNIGKHLFSEFGGDWTMYSSDLNRAKKTAEIINVYLNQEGKRKIRLRSELREQDFGIATGKSSEWFCEHKNVMKQGEPMIYFQPIEGAETGVDVYKRTEYVMKEVISSDEERILLVGHGGSCQMAVAIWLGIPIQALEKMAILGGAGGVSILTERFDGARVLQVWNNLSYRKDY